MPKRKCVFTEKLKQKFPHFRKGRDDFEAECLVCKPGTFVSVAHKGASDLEYHMSSEKHKKALGGEKWNAKVMELLGNPGGKAENPLAVAEGSLAFHTVMNHNSFKPMDGTSELLRKLFPNSDVAQKFSNTQIKTEATETSVPVPHAVNADLKALEEDCIPFYGVATDDSSHIAVKVFPILIQYYDYRNGGLKTKLLELQETPSETADTTSDYLVRVLKKHGLLQKCVAFTGDNCNTMLGGLRVDDAGRNVFSRLKKTLQKESLIGVSCPAHILHNCVHHGADLLDVDIESIILKIYQYFHIYTARTEPLKEYCDFVEVEYRKLLSHSKTRWLSLFPGITKLLQMYPSLKSFFLAQRNPPAVLKTFFEDDFSELYLWHMHSLMNAFHSHLEDLEREDNSLLEVMKTLDSVHTILVERRAQNFMSLTVKGMLADKHKEGLEAECNAFSSAVQGLYSNCIEYLEMWMASLHEFSCFLWMALSDVPCWSDVEACMKYLTEKGVEIDRRKCFDQFSNLTTFVEVSRDGEESQNLVSHQKWTKYFLKAKTTECYSELLKIAQFFFAIPPHSVNLERILSLTQSL